MFRYRLFVMASKHYQLLWNIVKQSQKFTISREFRELFIILSHYKTLSILTLLLGPLSSKWLWIFICLHTAKNIPFSKNYYYFFVCVWFQCIDHKIGWHHIYCVIVYLSQACKWNKAVFKHKTVKRNTLKFSKIMCSSSHKYLFVNEWDLQLMWMIFN